MLYLCVSFSVFFVMILGYLVRVDGQIRDLRRRLDVRRQNQ
jgi:hypothetical protein